MEQHEDFTRRMEAIEARLEALEGQFRAYAPASGSAFALEHGGEAARIIQVEIANRRYESGQYGDDHVWFDLVLTPGGLSRPTRAVKGTLVVAEARA